MIRQKNDLIAWQLHRAASEKKKIFFTSSAITSMLHQTLENRFKPDPRYATILCVAGRVIF